HGLRPDIGVDADFIEPSCSAGTLKGSARDEQNRAFPASEIFPAPRPPGICSRFVRTIRKRGETLEMRATEREASDPRETPRPDKAQLAEYYRQMLAIRRMEEALA